MRRLRQLSAVLVGTGATGLILFLGLMPRPDLLRLGVLPAQWARVIDQQYTLRHVAGFLVFHLVLVGAGSFAGWLGPLARRIRLTVALGFFALVLELAQFALPHRSVNLDDVLASWAGIALGFLLSEGIRPLFTRFQKPPTHRHDG